MAWPNPLRRRNEHTRTAWGYTFQLTEDHLTPDEMEPMKHSYDILGEMALNRLNDISSRKAIGREHGGPIPESALFESKRDLYVSLRDNAAKDDILGQLWAEVNSVPGWVDWDQIGRGQDCFYRYGGAMLTGLAFQSLLGGMGAARVVETLARTGGFSTKVARHRLFETTQHILQCTRSLESIRPGGAGFASSIRVRLLHAAVRQRIMKLAQQRPEYYSVQEWGIPINDLDCIATIGTFSATLIWLSLPRQGIWMTRQEVIDYIALWRYIAYLIGSPTDPFETPERTKKTMEVLLLYEIHPTETSKNLAANIIKCLEGQPFTFASKSFLEVNSRFLNGNELCDELGLGRPTLYYWVLMIGQCLFLMALCYSYRAVPYLDRRKIQTLRKVFWKVIVESEDGLGEETNFEFKYIPNLSKKTRMEDAVETGITQPGVERRNLQAFFVGCLLFGAVAFISLRIGAAVVQGLMSVWA